MSTRSQRWALALLVPVAVILAGGCNLLHLPAFLMMKDAKQEALLLTLVDDKKEVKAVIVAYSPTETRPELIRADRELCTLLARHLQRGFKENKEKVEIVSPRKVEKFKDDHPDWHALDLEEIGAHFEADYVIYLEIEALTLYERGSANMMYRGRADISVSVVDVHKPEEDPLTRHYDTEYPSNIKGAVPADDRNPVEFRQAFLDHVAKHLSWYFTAHPLKEEYSCE